MHACTQTCKQGEVTACRSHAISASPHRAHHALKVMARSRGEHGGGARQDKQPAAAHADRVRAERAALAAARRGGRARRAPVQMPIGKTMTAATGSTMATVRSTRERQPSQSAGQFTSSGAGAVCTANDSPPSAIRLTCAATSASFCELRARRQSALRASAALGRPTPPQARARECGGRRLQVGRPPHAGCVAPQSLLGPESAASGAVPTKSKSMLRPRAALEQREVGGRSRVGQHARALRQDLALQPRGRLGRAVHLARGGGGAREVRVRFASGPAGPDRAAYNPQPGAERWARGRKASGPRAAAGDRAQACSLSRPAN